MFYCLLMDLWLSFIYFFGFFYGSVLGFLVKDRSLCGILKAEIG